MLWGAERQSSGDALDGEARGEKGGSSDRPWSRVEGSGKGDGKHRSWSKAGSESMHPKGDGAYHDQKGWHQRSNASSEGQGHTKGWGQGSGQGWTKSAAKDHVASSPKQASSPTSTSGAEPDADGWTTVSKTRGKNLPEIVVTGANGSGDAKDLKTPHIQTQGNSFVTPNVTTKQSTWGAQGWTRSKYNTSNPDHSAQIDKEATWRSPSKKQQFRPRTESGRGADIEISMKIEESA